MSEERDGYRRGTLTLAGAGAIPGLPPFAAATFTPLVAIVGGAGVYCVRPGGPGGGERRVEEPGQPVRYVCAGCGGDLGRELTDEERAEFPEDEEKDHGE